MTTLEAPQITPELTIKAQGPSRSTAISAGHLRQATLKEVHRVIALHPKDPLASLKYAIARLAKDGAIPKSDVARLEAIATHVVAAGRGKVPAAKASARVRAVYDELIMDPGAGPVTIAIASLASTSAADGLSQTNGTAIAEAAPRQGGDIGMVGGAIVGAGIGFGIGGVAGGIIGSVVGGIAGGIAGACAD